MSLSRRPNIVPSSSLHLQLPEDLRARLDLTLFSEIEGCVPRGEYARFFSARIREYFEEPRIDLAPYGMPPGFYIRGPRDMVKALLANLKQGE